MISWILVVAEILAMFAIFWLLDGKPYQRRVLFWFFLLSVPWSCLALFLAGGASAWMKALCFGVSMTSLRKLDALRKKSK